MYLHSVFHTDLEIITVRDLTPFEVQKLLKVLKEYQISNFPPWLERQNQNDKELCWKWALTFSEALVFSADTDLKTTLSIPPQHYSYILSNDIHEVVRLIVHYVDLVSGEGQSFNSDWNNLE